MEINKLKLLCSTVKLQNLRKAAELHKLSPGGASKALKQLEEELGVRLFMPSGRGIVPTEECRRASARLEGILLDYSTLKEELRTKAKSSRPIRLGSFEVFTSHFLGELIESHFPDEQFTCIELTPGKIESAVVSADVDFGITYVPIPYPGIEFLKVAEMQMAIFGKTGSFHDKDFAEIPFAVPVTSLAGAPMHLDGLDGWPTEFRRKIKYRLELLESALVLCRKGKAAVFCPRFVASIQNKTLKPSSLLREIPAPKGMPKVSFDIFLVKRQSDEESPQMKRIAKAIRMLCR